MLLGTLLLLSQQQLSLLQHSLTDSPDPQHFITECPPTPTPPRAAHSSLLPQSFPLLQKEVLRRNPSQPHTGSSLRNAVAQPPSTLQGLLSNRRRDTSEETLGFSKRFSQPQRTNENHFSNACILF